MSGIASAKLVSTGLLSQAEFRSATKAAHVGAFTSTEGNIVTVYLAFDPSNGDIYVQRIVNGAIQNRYINDLQQSNIYKAQTTFLNYAVPVLPSLDNFAQLGLFLAVAVGLAITIYLVWVGRRWLFAFLLFRGVFGPRRKDD